jgi:dihydrofolate synthase/folylpolyglutamate synthase
MTPTNLAEWLSWQETLHPENIELGLDRVGAVASRLQRGLLEPSCKTVTVAGTNGKGSFVAVLEAILMDQGFRVGAYTSPHLLEYNERVRVNGQPVEDDVLCRAFENIEASREDLSLTYFEYGTLAALMVFQEADVDVQVLEVGLGGRLDAVNIVDPDIAVVTSIALDHQSWLGDDRELIAIEKAGILRHGKPVIVADPAPPASLKDRVGHVGATPAKWIGRDFDYHEKPGAMLVETGKGKLRLTGVTLPGPSVAAAIEAASQLGVPVTNDLGRCIESIELPGRFQQGVWKGQQVILDVAHNIEAAGYLARKLKSLGIKQVSCVFSALDDKDIEAISAELEGQINQWFIAALDVPRGATIEKLASSLGDVSGKVYQFDTIGAAMDAAVAQAEGGTCLLVCGSFFTVAESLKHMQPGYRGNAG